MTDRIDMGKWSEPGVPHKGWVCLGVDDLGPGELMTCQMCMVAQIRYVHAMVHDDYPEKLLCGCVCAGNMEGDVDRAAQRDRAAKSDARRRLAQALAERRRQEARAAEEQRLREMDAILARQRRRRDEEIRSLLARHTVRRIEETAREALSDREAFVRHPGWRTGDDGVLFIYSDGFKLEVSERNGVWGVVMRRPPSRRTVFHPSTFASCDDAKGGAYDLLTA
jgi:hypothetical protein